MSEKHLLLILICTNTVLFVGGLAVMSYITIRFANLLMSFHRAGTNLAQHQEELAKIAVRDKEADVAMVQARAAQTAAETQRETARKGPTGGQPRQLVPGSVGA